MAPSGWAIPEQRAWLESRVPDFQQAQRSNKTQAFRHEVHSAFFEKWPNPASEVISEPSGQKLSKSKSKTGSASLPLLPIAEWTELRKKQITNWFNNYKGVSKRRVDGGSSLPVINLGGSESRLSSETQIYSRLFYETRIRPVADQAMVGLAPNDPSRIAIINKCTNLVWKNEDEETKAAVYKERDNEKKAKERLKKKIGKSSTPEEYAAALVTLPAAMDAFFKEMGMRTGWSFTVLAGGPEPSHADGKIRTLALHVGVDRFDQQFSKAHEKFSDNCIAPFAAFLENVYSPEECMSRVLKKTDSVQLHAGQSLETGASEENRSESATETLPHVQQPPPEPSKEFVAHQTHQLHVGQSLEMGAKSLASEALPHAQQPLLELSKDSVAHQTQLRQLPFPDSQQDQFLQTTTSLQSSAEQMISAKPAHTVTPQEVTVTPGPRIQDSLSSITPAPRPELRPLAHHPIWSHQLTGSVVSNALQPMENTPIDHTFNHSSQIFSLPPTLGLPTSSDLSALQNTHWTAWGSEPFSYGMNLGGNTPVNSQLYNNAGPFATAFDFGSVSQSTVLTDTVASQAPTSPKFIHDDVLLAFQRNFTSTSGTSDVSPGEHLNNITAPNTPLLPQENPEKITAPGASSTVLEPLPLSDTTMNHTVLLSDSTTLPSTLQENDATTVVSGKENRSARLRKPATSKHMPTMIWRDQAYRYLLVDLDDDNWKDCVEKWLAFEKQEEGAFDTNSFRMGGKFRPQIFSKWVGTRNFNALPPIPDYADFAKDWIGWWNSVQPKWRQNPANGLPLDITSGKSKGNMSSVMKGGPSGLVTLLIGLKWWANIRDSDLRWGLAVQDLIGCFTSFITGSMKRKGDDVVTEESTKKKRKVG